MRLWRFSVWHRVWEGAGTVPSGGAGAGRLSLSSRPAVKPSTFFWLVLAAATALSVAIYQFFLPDWIKHGGPLVAVLITLTILVVALVFERILTLRRAAGAGGFAAYGAEVAALARAGRIADAIERSREQGGWGAGVIATGLEHYQGVERHRPTDRLSEFEEVRRGLARAAGLAAPPLERNLTALSTIASIATMVGLLGTTIGMIRAFAALANAGAPDAVQLSMGISEALINTAGGLVAAIVAIVAYNYFTAKVDGLTHETDEVAAEVTESLPLTAPTAAPSAVFAA